MIDPINSLNETRSFSGQAVSALVPTRAMLARKEFMTIFYKELLKQVFAAPNLSVGEEEENNPNSYFSSINSDILVEKLAGELAQKATYQMNWVPSPEVNK
jgi:hypothetical protein